MKLFGGNGEGRHTANPSPKHTVSEKNPRITENAAEKTVIAAPARVRAEKPKTETAELPVNKPSEQETPLYGRLFHAPVWQKLRKPLIIAGCVVLGLLVAVLIYAIWEKPPETREDGISPVHTIAPGIQEPVADDPEKPKYTPAIPEETEEPTETETPEAEPTTEPLTNARRENCYTFLILAYDQLQANTDTILVGRMDTGAGTLDMVNIPRDTLVNVSWGVKKLNTVLASERNDPTRFLEHLGNLIGFTVDCYAVVDIRAMEKLVDCIGGVYYNVPRDMDYDDPTQELHIHIPKGYQLLNGEDAVKVLRFRVGNDGSGYYNGDLGRIATQQDFLKTAAAQFLKLGNIPNLAEATKIIQNYVKTDLTANNIAFFAREFLLLDQTNIRFHTLPGQEVNIRGGSYYEVNINDWVGIVNDFLNPYEQVVTVDNLNILQSNADGGATTNSGEVIPKTQFYDFSKYTG